MIYKSASLRPKSSESASSGSRSVDKSYLIMTFEGQAAKPSKIKSVMKWWSKCISMVIAKTASRNVALKSAKLVESVFAGQSVVQTRQVAMEDISSEVDFEDLGRNADLYIFNQ